MGASLKREKINSVDVGQNCSPVLRAVRVHRVGRGALQGRVVQVVRNPLELLRVAQVVPAVRVHQIGLVDQAVQEGQQEMQS